MSKARVIISAVVLEGRSQAQVARDYGVSQSWVSRLVARYRTEGDTAFEPRSRRPNSRPAATPPDTITLVTALRRSLTSQGLDAGPVTIAWHLEHHHRIRLSRATLPRIIRRAELETPEPRKKPRASYVRFQAEQPDEPTKLRVVPHRRQTRRTITPLRTTKKTTTRTLNRSSGLADVSRHHTVETRGIEPLTSTLQRWRSAN